MVKCPFPNAPTIPVDHNPCGLCGSERSALFAESYDYEYRTCNNLWQFVKCLDCNSVYLNPRPNRQSLGRIYPSDYYAYNYDERINMLARLAKDRIDRARFRAIRKELDIELNTFLDIGCGNGRYLKAVADIGLARRNIYGIELNESIAEALCAEGFQVFATRFEEIDVLPKGNFDLITLFSVLEHLANPREVLSKVRSLLRPRGLLVFEVPNIESTNARLFRDHYWGGYHTPRHWFFLSRSIVKEFSGRMGFTVKRIEMTTGHSFWLWSMHHFLRYRIGLDRVGRLLNPGKCLPGLALVTAVDMVRTRLRSQTDNMLVFLQK